MSKIAAAVFIFLFTLVIAIYNFCREAYIFAWITMGFVILDVFVMLFTIIKELRKR